MFLENYVYQFREDFSMMACPLSMVKLPSPHRDGDRSYSNGAEKGYILSSVAKRKIKSAAINIYAKCTRAEQLRLRFVTFTFPSLPAHLDQLSIQEQDAKLHEIFLKFIDNERKETKKRNVWTNRTA